VLNGEVVAMFDEPAIFVKQADAFCRCVTTTAAQLVKLVKTLVSEGSASSAWRVTGQCLLRAAKRVEFGKAEVADARSGSWDRVEPLDAIGQSRPRIGAGHRGGCPGSRGHGHPLAAMPSQSSEISISSRRAGKQYSGGHDRRLPGTPRLLPGRQRGSVAGKRVTDHRLDRLGRAHGYLPTQHLHRFVEKTRGRIVVGDVERSLHAAGQRTLTDGPTTT